MIKIIVELHPFGDSSKKKVLAIANIINDGSGDLNNGNYDIKLSKVDRKNEPVKIWKEGRVEGFKRQRKGVWDLLYLGLKNIIGDRN